MDHEPERAYQQLRSSEPTQPFYKKTSVLIASCIIVGFLLMTPFFFYLRSTQKPIPSQKNTTLHSQLETKNSVQVFTSMPFTLSYPQTWQSHYATSSAVQTTVSFGPFVSAKTGKPGITIDSRTATSDAQMNQAEEPLVNTFGFTMMMSTIDTLPAVYLSGIMPVSIKNGKIENSPHVEEIVDVYHKKRWYRLMFSYGSETRDPETQRIFRHIRESFHITQ